jgi:hypothetical protein
VLEAQRGERAGCSRSASTGASRRLAEEIGAFHARPARWRSVPVNAGPIPPDLGPRPGGRRRPDHRRGVPLRRLRAILVGAELVEVFAYALGGRTAALHDTVTITLRYAGGSVASINYFSTGDKSFAKERWRCTAAAGSPCWTTSAN